MTETSAVPTEAAVQKIGWVVDDLWEIIAELELEDAPREELVEALRGAIAGVELVYSLYV
jgi:hypothetical protein